MKHGWGDNLNIDNRRRTLCAVFTCLALAFAFAIGPAAAQTADGADADAQAIAAVLTARDRLFDAQTALMMAAPGDTTAAAQAAALADEAAQAVRAAAPDTLTAALDAPLAAAAAAARAGDGEALARARARFWTDALRLSIDSVFAAFAAEDAARVERWLGLREYRSSTRFSRPGADATLAVRAWAAGALSADAARDAAYADLYDTVQAQMNGALADADEAAVRGFTLRLAEETALAHGYFRILGDAYRAQQGEAAAQAADAAFERLTTAAPGPAYTAARADAAAALVGFRAAPLSEDEAARRTGQLVRFIALVPVEYARGVREAADGWQVTSDLEIQEALTFRDGAAAAFSDLHTALNGLNSAHAAAIGEALDRLLTHIRAVEAPGVVQAEADLVARLLRETVPAAWLETNADSDLDVIFSILDQIQAAAAQGEYALAESARIEAYAVLETGLEQRLRGFAPDLAMRVETLFWSGTPEQRGLGDLLATRAPFDEVRAGLGALRAALAEAQAFLGSMDAAPEAVIGNAAIIVFREGLEAVVILASLLASLRTAEEQRYRRSIVLGGVLALAATAITWWVANGILQVLLPLGERLEAVVSLIAIGVLLLITNWFFHKVYWTGWMANFHQRKRAILGGVAVVTLSQTVGLIILGFTSIYREGFETVLFLQSLVLEAGLLVVLEGVAVGMVGVALIGAITFTVQKRLPYRKMLVVTGVFIGAVLLTMVGNTTHVMQAVGWLPITPIQGVFVPYWMGQWFGLYATWQGVLLQGAAAAFVIGSYFLAERQTGNRRKAPQAERAPHAAGAGD
jgi:high-affinity iron transporter